MTPLRLLFSFVGLLPAIAGTLAVLWLSSKNGTRARSSHLVCLAATCVLGFVLLGRLGSGAHVWPNLASVFSQSAMPTQDTASLAALKLALLQNTVFALVALGLFFVGPSSGGHETKTPRGFRIALGSVTLLVSLLSVAVSPLTLEAFLDVAALGPLFGCVLFVSGLPVAEQVEAKTRSLPSAKSQAPPLDAETILRRANLLSGKPDFAFAASSVSETSSREMVRANHQQDLAVARLEMIWSASGGTGKPPSVFELFLAALSSTEPSQKGLWLGDLPPQTLEVVATSFVGFATLHNSTRLLVVSTNPRQVLAQFEGLCERLGVMRPGVFAVGHAALKEQLLAELLPSVVFLSPHELSGEALRSLTRLAPAWFSQLSAVVLVGVDGLLPIPATHLALALRRLMLASKNLLSEGRRLRFFALSCGSECGRQHLEHALACSFETVKVEPHKTAAAQVFLRTHTASGPELERFAKQLLSASQTIEIEDTLGEAAQVAQGVKKHDTVGYHGLASLALCDERALAQLFRTGSNLLHTDAPHLSIVWCKPNPLARFLMEKGVLASLSARNELPTPKPLAGTENDFLVAAHVEAALDEGEPGEDDLRLAFSDGAVSALLSARKDVQKVGFRARFFPDERKVSRSVRLHRKGEPLGPDRLKTITPNVVEVRRRHDGAVLARVDRRLARTRFYPRRVFAHEGELYEVLDSDLATETNLVCAKAAASSAPTLPLLDVRVSGRAYIGNIARHQFGKLAFARGVASVSVEETVSGVLARGAVEPAVRYPAVETRYESRAVVVLFETVPQHATLKHLARLVDLLLPAHVVTEDEDIEVLAYPDGFLDIPRPALLFVDRHLGGLGLDAALDAQALYNLLRWAWGVLYSCPCMKGCAQCVPASVLKQGPDKQGVLQLLGG